MGSVKKIFNKLPTTKIYKSVFDPDDPGEGQQRQVNALYRDAANTQRQQFQQGLTTMRSAAAQYAPAYEKAKRLVSVGRGASMDRAMDASKVAGAQVEQNLGARGLTNSTIAENARIGIGSQLSRDMADIDAMYSSLLGGLETEQAGMTAGALGQIGGAQIGFGNSAAGLAGNHANAIASIQHTDPNAWLNSLLGIGGTFAGIGLMGGFGGGGALPATTTPSVIPGTV